MSTLSSGRLRRGPEHGPTPATPGLIRSINDRVVLDLLVQHGTLTRSDVRRLTGVSKPTASQSLSRLEASGHVLQVGVEQNHRGGRAPAVYQLNPRTGFAAALNVTTTGIHVQIADLVGTVIGEHHSTNSADPDSAVQALQRALQDAQLNMAELSSIVIALPGSYDPAADVLRFSGDLPLWQKPGLLAHIEQLTDVPSHVENDVNLVAAAERRYGAVKGEDNFFLLWGDQGVGGALMLDGRLHRGSSGGAGEIAFLPIAGAPVVHNPVRQNYGGFDDLVGVDRIVELGEQHGITGDVAIDIVASAVVEQHNEFLTELAGRYAAGLAAVVALIDPATIVLAGSILTAGAESLRAAIETQLLDVAIRSPRLILGEIVDQPVISGALLVSLDNTRDRIFAT